MYPNCGAFPQIFLTSPRCATSLWILGLTIHAIVTEFSKWICSANETIPEPAPSGEWEIP